MGAGDRLGATVDAQLAVDVDQVGLDGAQLDDEVACQFGIGTAGRQEAEHGQLARAQRLDW
jgi:hypothetical protein